MLYRFFITSAMALTLSMPAYSSVVNPGKDADQGRRDELVDLRHTKKIKTTDPDDTFVVPTFKPMTGAELRKIIAQANSGNESAQDEVANRYYWGLWSFDSSVTIQTWGNLQERARLSAVYCNLLLKGLNADDLNHAHPNIIADLMERGNGGNPVAQNLLGHAYREGKGIAKDPVKAVEWYQKAADQGFAPAQFWLGNACWQGTGIAKDPVKAVEWYQKAADQGLAAAQNNLGHAYRGGKGIAKDPVKAVEWYQKAADQGFAHAQTNLGYAYWQGTGIAKDPVKAVEWYQKAAQQGELTSIKYLKKILVLQPNVTKADGSFIEKTVSLYDSIVEITSHCEQKLVINKGAHGMREAQFALDPLVRLYTPISEFGDRLSPVFLELTKTQPGFLVSCIKASEELSQACLAQQVPTSLLIRGDTITLGERNVAAVLQFERYLQTMGQEFNQARRDLDNLIYSLYPSVASLHACQQAAISGDENAVERFNQELAEYNEVLSINKREIDRLEHFKANLNTLEKELPNLMPSTIGMRNREFLESKEFGFLNG